MTEREKWNKSLSDYAKEVTTSDPDAKKVMALILKYKKAIKNRGSAIRAMCIQCVGSLPDIKTCECSDCPLWLFRNGADAFRSSYTEKEKNPRPKTVRKPAKKKVVKQGNGKVNAGLIRMQELNRQRREAKLAANK